MRLKPGFIILTLTTFTALAVLSACTKPAERPEIEQCESDALFRLHTPATYKRVEANIFDSVMLDRKEFQRRAGLLKQPSRDRLRLRTVFLTYDAQNEYGALVRTLKACHFKVTEEQRSREPNPPFESKGGGNLSLPSDLEPKAEDCCIRQDIQ